MDKNNKKYIFYVPQGGFAIFKISENNESGEEEKKKQEEEQKFEEVRAPKINEVFTDGLGPCSCVIIIIKKPNISYCIFAHMDTCTMNISDPNIGLFKQILNVIGPDRDSSSVKIYHEIGLKQQNLANNINHFDYEQFFEMQLVKYNFKRLSIEINKETAFLDHRVTSVELNSLKITDKENGGKNTSNSFRDLTRKKRNYKLILNKQTYIEQKRNKLYDSYKTNITKIIQEKLTKNKNNSNETIQEKINCESYIGTVNFLLKKEDFPFPPFCVLNTVDAANDIPKNK